jgi:hypothetical protein
MGARFHVRQPKLRPSVWEVTQLEAGRRFVWTTSAPGFAIRADHIVEAAGADESELTLTIRFSGVFGPLLGLLAAGTVKDYLAIEASSLKSCAESDGLRPTRWSPSTVPRNGERVHGRNAKTPARTAAP